MEFDINSPKEALEYLNGINPLDLDSLTFVRLSALASHREESIREVANEILFRSGEPDAINYLEKLAINKDEGIRLSAQRVLYKAEIASLIDNSKIPLETKSNSSKPTYSNEDFIWIPGSASRITKFLASKGKSWYSSHFDLQKQGLKMPAASVFMPYYRHVIKAMQGKVDLIDGNMRVVKDDEVERIYRDLINIRCWLDNFTTEGGELETNHLVHKKELYGYSEPFEKYLISNDSNLANLNSLNRQGYPTRPSKLEDFVRGENIIFIPPKNGSSTLFVSGIRADCLVCNGTVHMPDLKVGSYGCLIK